MYKITTEKQLEYCVYHKLWISIDGNPLFIAIPPEFDSLKQHLGKIITEHEDLPEDIFPKE